MRNNHTFGKVDGRPIFKKINRLEFSMRIALAACALALASFTHQAYARDTTLHLPIQDVLNSPDYQQKVGNGVRFYFGNQPAPKALKSFGELVTNKKTNGFSKKDVEACRWAMLSALIQFKERAESEGANAVVNIVSYYKKDVFSSPTEYECHAGAFVTGVALKGHFIKAK